MDFYELTKARYSVRKYADKPVEEEKLRKVLEAGATAPTAKNQQPQHIYVLESKEAIEKIRGITRCAFDARKNDTLPSAAGRDRAYLLYRKWRNL